VSVVIYPSLVQGAGAAVQLRQALALANDRQEVDTLLLVRGGGSLEDLFSFNDEALARDIAASVIPVVSGVGHETDFTIADFVADLRAPTPSAAAELVVKNQGDVIAKISQLERSLLFALSK
jgi:exodeoxyribonuclease VII large subunit